ncbi:flagellar hook-associated protein 1 FlgK [Geodermatophilus pulveris]|uniref:Flagellar hook-associated protein 1 n=1 Tax=Geodermatophilus pulveris TaxID=1564159 RepID=A0A239GPW4_9ACTN|nr:flagellar hook-associated protein FlgK [Geodermatophilus pulveris]SNS71249.1 flagellar hook-associated protein 1 FlgK [Geodermatophilus pulveris]
MTSTFGGLNTARTALWAAQRGLDLTGQNVANVNTEGYSRQRVDLQAVGGTAVPALHSVSSPVGGGVDAGRVTRIRDVFLEQRAHTEISRTAELTVAAEALGGVEAALREPGDTGLQSMLADVWTGFSEVANNPTEPAARGLVLERLDILAGGLHTARATLDQQWTQTRDDLQALVADVNATATSIGELNTAIGAASRAGLPVNELADRRDLLVVSLAERVGATVRPAADGMVDVLVGGSTLVSGGATLGLQLAGADTPDGVGTGDDPRVRTDPGGTTIAIGGTAGGQLAALTDTIPGYRGRLDQMARDLVGRLNAVQAAGYDATGASGADQPLLDDGSGTVPVDPATVHAGNITVRVSDPALLAVAASSPAAVGGQPSADGDNADAFFRLSLAPDGVDAGYRQLVVALGVESAVASRDLEVQTVISTQVDAARESVSGVNLDEEMTTMLSFQHAYGAAARMVTAIDEAIDTLITRTGLVGR